MGTYTVYTHINKINGKQYIGITSTDVNMRWQNGRGYDTQEVFYNDIIKYGWDNFEHKILYKNLSKEEAREKEIELIKKYRTWIGYEDCQGYNTSLNISGSAPKKVMQYTLDGVFIKEYNSAYEAIVENNWRVASAGLIQAVCRQVPQYKSYQNYLWKYSNDKRDISEWVKRYKIIENPQKKTIYQYDLNKNFIGKYPSGGIAAKAVGGDAQNICAVARGKRNKASGYIWTYIPLNEEDELKEFTCYDK